MIPSLPSPLGPLRRLAGDERGVAAVEAALAVPFLVMIGFGLFEFGAAYHQTQLMQTGVREAARYLARTPNPAAAEAVARNLAVTGSAAGDRPSRVKGWTPAEVAVSYEATANPRDRTTGLRAYRSGDQVMVVRVSTSMPSEGLGLLAAVGLGRVTLAAAHEERVIGQ